MKILIDNGHGFETPGKRSPGGELREYSWTRKIASRVVEQLCSEGYDAELLVAENSDVPLRTRVARANAKTRANGVPAKTLLVSVHVNAAGNGTQWGTARGWSVYVAPNCSARSRRLAECFAAEAERAGLKVRRQQPGCGYWTQPLAMTRDTVCPAVLTENLFMDNAEDVSLLLSAEGADLFVKLHTEAIKSYIAGESSK